MVVRSYESLLFADYFQFYLQDDSPEAGGQNPWNGQATDDLLAVAPGLVCVKTARNMIVPVQVRIHGADPGLTTDGWDHVTECCLTVRSGRIVVAGCPDYLRDATRIAVELRVYSVRILYKNLESLSANGLEGEDQYVVLLWPGEASPPRVVKRRSVAAGPR